MTTVPVTREKMLAALEAAFAGWKADQTDWRTEAAVCADLVLQWLAAARAPAVATDDAALIAECRALIPVNARGYGKVGAIKRVREVRGCGLFDAKEWVEAHCYGEPAPVDGVRVRVAVAVNPDGEWNAVGANAETDDALGQDAVKGIDGPALVSIITAIVPRPHPPAEIAATVEQVPT